MGILAFFMVWSMDDATPVIALNGISRTET
jgi:hypothetical protein